MIYTDILVLITHNLLWYDFWACLVEQHVEGIEERQTRNIVTRI